MKLADNSWDILLVDINTNRGLVKLSVIDWVLPRWLEVSVSSYPGGTACLQLTAASYESSVLNYIVRFCELLLNKPCFTHSRPVDDYRGTKAYIDITKNLAGSSSFLPKDRG